MSIGADRPERVLIADTCSFLDIARSAWRHESPAGDVKAALKLEAVAKDKDELVVAVCDVSIQEFDNHIESVELEGRNGLASLRKRVVHADEVAGHLGVSRLSESTVGWAESLVKEAVAVSRRLIAGATVIPLTPDDQDRGFRRSIEGRPPARRGSPNTFDCYITECAIRIASGRPRSTTYFLSSNRKDFGGPAKLRPELASDFEAAGLVYATSWSELAARIQVG